MKHQVRIAASRLSVLFEEFFRSERAGGFLLIACAAISLLVANSFLGPGYARIWHYEIIGEHLEHWINDGLMSVFFLLIGLELRREVFTGELSTLKKAGLPVVAALGGMLVPAALFLVFNFGTPTQSGAGIPMATDIAFAVGVLSLLGSKVPRSLLVVLTALAVIDDLGAILVIAIFYTGSLDHTNLLLAISVFVALLLMNKLRIRYLVLYLLGGVVMWYFMLHSGVHATLSGVLLALTIPFDRGQKESPAYRLQHFLHRPVAFLILPLFALANTAIVIDRALILELDSANSTGILVGLILGKPVGIFVFSFVFVALGICVLPKDLRWAHVIGAGILGGIGFTMSIFITLLAYDNPALVTQSKMSILLASLFSGIVGYMWLRRISRSRHS